MNQKVKDFYQKIQLDEESKMRIHDFELKNPYHTDWGEKFSKIYFWVKNDCDYPYDVNFCLYPSSITVPAHSGWVKFELDDPKTFFRSAGASYGDLIDMEDCVGAFLRFTRLSAPGMSYGDIYISNIYGERITEGE